MHENHTIPTYVSSVHELLLVILSRENISWIQVWYTFRAFYVVHLHLHVHTNEQNIAILYGIFQM